MTTYRDQAVVLRTYKLGESDRIVVLLTEEHGKVRAVAKGVRKTRSRLGSRLEPMSHVAVLLYRGRDLDTVNQVEVMETASGLRSSLDKMTQGLAMCEAVDQVTPDREPAPHLYTMLVRALQTLAESGSPLVLAGFFWKLLAAEGLAPELDRCVQCRSCRTGRAITPAALALLRMVLGGQLSAALSAPESPATHEVTQLATTAVELHCERRLRSVGMFERHD
jgi:DNA repair protein RecO (recombination protein O)